MATDWSAYDAPALSDAVTHRAPGGCREALIRIHGIHCSGCVGTIETAVLPLCERVLVSLGTSMASLRWDENKTRLSTLLQAIEAAGFRPEPLSQRQDLLAEQRERRRLLLRIGIAGILSMQVMMLAATRYADFGRIDPSLELVMRYAQWVLATPVLLFAAWPFLGGALRSLKAGGLSMDVPIAIALVLAYGASSFNVITRGGNVYFDSVTMFVFLLLVARWFEGRGRAEATLRLRELASAQPLCALREHNDQVREVASSELVAGDIVLVPPASAIAADGLLVSESAELDESLLTGEAGAAVRSAGHPVYAGSINAGSSPLRVEVTSTGSGTMLSYINHLVQHAQMQRPRVQRLADRVAGVITLAVIVIAAAAAGWWWPRSHDMALQAALAVLVVTCPCALSLATPAALAAAASALARRGVLLTRPDALLALPRVDTVCFDKTGTLTTGTMRCVRIELRDESQTDHAFSIAAALERGIHHPIATAFVACPGSLTASRVQTKAGHGISGEVDGVEYQLVGCAGKHALTWLSLTSGGLEVARFGLEHRIRSEARDVVRQLRSEGLDIILLSGDGGGAVADIAGSLGIDDYRAQLKPADKLAALQALHAQGRRVWMIGDGVNDAPTLAAADVSTSLASASALAQANAGLLLTGNDLGALPVALALARRTRRVIGQNLAWAALYNIVAIPLAVTGELAPWMAALGMGLSSLTVVGNSLRLARYRHRGLPTTFQPDLGTTA